MEAPVSPGDQAMKIACLGWGSLVWHPGNLPLSCKWKKDGPALPIEFARESSRSRITLIISDVPDTVVSLWALMSVDTLDAAKFALAKREDVPDEYIQYSIGWWRKLDGASHGRGADVIAKWAPAYDLDAVVWTNLKPGFKKGAKTVPPYADVLKYFQGLIERGEHAPAEEYVRKAPEQVMTPYRRSLQKDLGWTPIRPSRFACLTRFWRRRAASPA
ncbi:MAG: hypothetical protein AB7V46_13390 [Thermomicrobiales bacterium]